MHSTTCLLISFQEQAQGHTFKGLCDTSTACQVKMEDGRGRVKHTHGEDNTVPTSLSNLRNTMLPLPPPPLIWWEKTPLFTLTLLLCLDLDVVQSISEHPGKTVNDAPDKTSHGIKAGEDKEWRECVGRGSGAGGGGGAGGGVPSDS